MSEASGPDPSPPQDEMHKNSAYVRTLVSFHEFRDKAREAVDSLKDRPISQRVHDSWNKTRSAVSGRARTWFSHPEDARCSHIPQRYGYVFRPKSLFELLLLGGTVCGIEFCYSAETAYVTPILLGLGLDMKFVTMIWCLSPLVGLFLTPMLGSLSDGCGSPMGRRRPFVLLYSLGIILGLLLVPNGHRIGLALGDTSHLIGPPNLMNISEYDYGPRSHAKRSSDTNTTMSIDDWTKDDNVTSSIGNIDSTTYTSAYEEYVPTSEVPSEEFPVPIASSHIQPWSIVFTVIGGVLLDFCSDACQSPSRTYLLDVTLPKDHATGLSTFTFMAGLGGSIGYVMGAIHWDNTLLGDLLGGQVQVVFTIVTVVFVVCLLATLCSFPEIPLSVLRDPDMLREYEEKMQPGKYEGGRHAEVTYLEGQTQIAVYGATDGVDVETGMSINATEEEKKAPTSETVDMKDLTPAREPTPTVHEYLKSIVQMPPSLRILCLTNLFCWMSLVCYSLYFTDFVGRCVYEGDPAAPEDSRAFQRYHEGVQFGCWGMALYSLSCSCYSFFIEKLVAKLGAKKVYAGGQLVYSLGMVAMAVSRHKVAVILLSPTAGVMYSTLFTMPYLLIAHYHCKQQFSEDGKGCCGIRGIGTDVAAVSSMVFLSQFLLSLTMGSIVEAVGSTVATVCAAAILSACGAVAATQVVYLGI